MLDGHIHMAEGARDRERFYRRLQAAGMDSGVLLSLPPVSFGTGTEAPSPAARLDALFSWCQEGPNLYPFHWIDPIEEDASAQLEKAVERSVMGFKVICDRYYPGDERAMATHGVIARTDRPILFRSGILWDGKPSARYNRPGEFEAAHLSPRGTDQPPYRGL
jgi:hypothetical protein